MQSEGIGETRTGVAGRRARLWRSGCIAGLLLALYGASAEPVVQAAQFATEYQVKAAFLFNFLRFVEWPDDATANTPGKWVIGIAGSSPVGYELARLVQGKNVGGRELQVKTIQGQDDLRRCHILFISATERKRLPSMLAELRGSSVLTVADMDEFVESGGMVQFVVEHDRVHLTIDLAATTRARLKVSSKLLALAHTVTGAADN